MLLFYLFKLEMIQLLDLFDFNFFKKYLCCIKLYFFSFTPYLIKYLIDLIFKNIYVSLKNF